MTPMGGFDGLLAPSSTSAAKIRPAIQRVARASLCSVFGRYPMPPRGDAAAASHKGSIMETPTRAAPLPHAGRGSPEKLAIIVPSTRPPAQITIVIVGDPRDKSSAARARHLPSPTAEPQLRHQPHIPVRISPRPPSLVVP